MKRRDFILTSGSAVLSGFVGTSLQKPVIGLDFEISYPDEDPSNVDSLLVEFRKLEVTPQYLDKNDPVTVQTELNVAGQTKQSGEIQKSIENGQTEELKNDIDPMIADGISTSSIIEGEVIITVNHPDVQESYSQKFYLTESLLIPDSGINENWINVTSASYEEERSIPYDPYNTDFTVNIEATENDNHSSDESVEVELGVRVKDSNGNTIDELSESVIFGGGANGTTKTGSNSGSLTSGDSWVFFIKCYTAPVTRYSPNQMDVDASVTLTD